jgi:hypothetical protein
MDDVEHFPSIVTEIDWIACTQPDFIAEKQDMILGRLMQVRRRLARELGSRRMDRLQGVDTNSRTMSIRTLKSEIEGLEELLQAPSWRAETHYAERLIQRLPKEWQYRILQGLSSDFEEPLTAQALRATSGRYQVRVTLHEYTKALKASSERGVSEWLRSLLEQIDFRSDDRDWRLPKRGAKLSKKLWCRVPARLTREINMHCRRNAISRSIVLRSVVLSGLDGKT